MCLIGTSAFFRGKKDFLTWPKNSFKRIGRAPLLDAVAEELRVQDEGGPINYSPENMAPGDFVIVKSSSKDPLWRPFWLCQVIQNSTGVDNLAVNDLTIILFWVNQFDHYDESAFLAMIIIEQVPFNAQEVAKSKSVIGFLQWDCKRERREFPRAGLSLIQKLVPPIRKMIQNQQ